MPSTLKCRNERTRRMRCQPDKKKAFLGAKHQWNLVNVTLELNESLLKFFRTLECQAIRLEERIMFKLLLSSLLVMSWCLSADQHPNHLNDQIIIINSKTVFSGEKQYISLDQICLSNEGIFAIIDGTPIQLLCIMQDSEGYFIVPQSSSKVKDWECS